MTTISIWEWLHWVSKRKVRSWVANGSTSEVSKGPRRQPWTASLSTTVISREKCWLDAETAGLTGDIRQNIPRGKGSLSPVSSRRQLRKYRSKFVIEDSRYQLLFLVLPVSFPNDIKSFVITYSQFVLRNTGTSEIHWEAWGALHTYTSIHIYTCVYTYIYLHTHTQTCSHKYICIYIKHVFLHTYTYIHYVYMCNIRTQIYTDMCICVFTHPRTHVCVFLWSLKETWVLEWNKCIGILEKSGGNNVFE